MANKEIQLINAMKISKGYINSKYKKRNSHDKIMMITKDADGKKEMRFIEEPKRTFYTLKPEYDNGTYYPAVPIEWTNEIIGYEKDKIKDIVTALNDQTIKLQFDMANDAYRNNDGKSAYEIRKSIEKDRRVFDSDSNIVDHYIAKFNRTYTMPKGLNLTVGVYDIEVDGSEIEGFPDEESAMAPVNIITYYNSQDNICYSYQLAYDTDDYKKTMHDNAVDIIDALNKRYEGRNIKFVINEYHSELELITDFFKQVNEDKLDFMIGWNSVYDNLTLLNRLTKLSSTPPEEIMCPKEAKYKSVYFKKDERALDVADTFHIFDIVSYSTWIDEQTLYANITKPTGKRESYSLDYIGEYELGEHKDEYDGDIKTLHLHHYRQFILYNIQDVILLFDIEHKLGYLNLLYSISSSTNTRLSVSLKKTISIRNFGELHYFESGKVMSNNHNELYGDGGKIPGALTYKRTLNHVNCWELLKGTISSQS